MSDEKCPKCGGDTRGERVGTTSVAAHTRQTARRQIDERGPGRLGCPPATEPPQKREIVTEPTTMTELKAIAGQIFLAGAKLVRLVDQATCPGPSSACRRDPPPVLTLGPPAWHNQQTKE
jgi:hypothetical protein